VLLLLGIQGWRYYRTKEAAMELAWKWRDYAFSIKVLRRRGESRAEPRKENEIVESAAIHNSEDEVHREHLMASGSRYVGPMR
jgi:hypothetical protein